VSLPGTVSAEGARAKLDNGVLSVTLPKMQIEENKKILIE
jgi:HSP20 family protein